MVTTWVKILYTWFNNGNLFNSSVPKAKLCEDWTTIVQGGKGESYACFTDVKKHKKNHITLIKILCSRFEEISEVKKRDFVYSPFMKIMNA